MFCKWEKKCFYFQLGLTIKFKHKSETYIGKALIGKIEFL